MAKATISPMLSTRAARRVYFDGGCPVCRREVTWYRGLAGAERIDWIDLASDPIAPGLDRDQMLRRFTVERADGLTVSGAAGFIALWRALPATRRVGRALDNGMMRWILERAYRGFLHLRRLWRSAP